MISQVGLRGRQEYVATQVRQHERNDKGGKGGRKDYHRHPGGKDAQPQQHTKAPRARIGDGAQEGTEDAQVGTRRNGERQGSFAHPQSARNGRQKRVHHAVGSVEDNPHERDQGNLDGKAGRRVQNGLPEAGDG